MRLAFELKLTALVNLLNDSVIFAPPAFTTPGGVRHLSTIFTGPNRGEFHSHGDGTFVIEELPINLKSAVNDKST